MNHEQVVLGRTDSFETAESSEHHRSRLMSLGLSPEQIDSLYEENVEYLMDKYHISREDAIGLEDPMNGRTPSLENG